MQAARLSQPGSEEDELEGDDEGEADDKDDEEAFTLEDAASGGKSAAPTSQGLLCSNLSTTSETCQEPT